VEYVYNVINMPRKKESKEVRAANKVLQNTNDLADIQVSSDIKLPLCTKDIETYNDRGEFWNEFCTKLSGDLYKPVQDSEILLKKMPCSKNEKHKSTEHIEPTKLLQYTTKPALLSGDATVCRKIKLGVPKQILGKLNHLFAVHKYFYTKAINYMNINCFELYSNTILKNILKLTKCETYNVDKKFNNDVFDNCFSIEANSNYRVNFKFIKRMISKVSISDISLRNIVVPNENIPVDHPDFKYIKCPRQVKSYAAINAHTDYTTGFINYMVRLINSYAKKITYGDKIKLPVFKSNECVSDVFTIDSASINLKEGILFRTYFSRKNYPVVYDHFVAPVIHDRTEFAFKMKDKCLKNLDENSVCDSKIIKANNEYFLCLVLKVKKDTNFKPRTIASCDPGVRTFQTVYSPEGITAKLGIAHGYLIKKHYKRIDDIKSVINNRKLKSRTKYRMKLKIKKLEQKIKNITNELHSKTINYLTTNYNTIIMPKTVISSMVKTGDSNIIKDTKRQLLGLSHFKFREKLKQTCERRNCTYINVSEAYTSKTCGKCGEIKKDLKGDKIFTCGRNECDYSCDRDIHGARNIYIRIIKSVYDLSRGDARGTDKDLPTSPVGLKYIESCNKS